ncbi:MAG: DNA/RNA nuclease SfsA [Bacteroidales bacterium]
MSKYIYTYPQELVRGRLIRRYKRFLADIELPGGEKVIAHCTNSGSMKSALDEGAEVAISPVTDPKRKTRFTWEMIRINGSWVGINTNIPNILAAMAMEQGLLDPLQGYSEVRREVKFLDSRFDVFGKKGDEECFVEAKNVSLNEDGIAMFPDAVTIRGQKHLDTLVKVVESGKRAVMLYVIQRTDVTAFAPAAHIDPAYAAKLQQAISKGVEVIPWQIRPHPTGYQSVGILKRTNQQPRVRSTR